MERSRHTDDAVGEKEKCFSLARKINNVDEMRKKVYHLHINYELWRTYVRLSFSSLNKSNIKVLSLSHLTRLLLYNIYSSTCIRS